MSDTIDAAETRLTESESAERRREVLATLDTIEDPCSVAFGKPVGLVGMGMVERLDIRATGVSVLLLPTFPTCMFRGVFEEEIEKRLSRLGWCKAVAVAFCSGEARWDESRMSEAARHRLGRDQKAAARISYKTQEPIG